VKEEVHATSSPPNSTLSNKVDFNALDTNRDGNLSRTEVSANATLTADFNAIDANRDGRITQSELAGGK
jgi:Ca2+-binding EF-hand superfamily protein